MVNLFQFVDRLPLATLLIFYHVGWEVTQESELLLAAVAVMSCYVNDPRASRSSLLGGWHEVLLVLTTWGTSWAMSWEGVGVPVSKEVLVGRLC